MTAYDTVLAALEASGSTVKASGQGVIATCPAHPDSTPSLKVTPSIERVLLYCHAGCTQDAVTDALGLHRADLFDNPRGRTYSYPGGRLVHRTPDKRFRQSGNTKDSSLYRLDEVKLAVELGQAIYVVEGEQDADAIVAVTGKVATCSPMGAGKWGTVDPSPLRGADVTVVVDRDEPGRKHAADIMKSLGGQANSLRFVEALTGKDAADHLAAGHGLDELVPIELGDGQSDSPRMKLWRITDMDDDIPIWLAIGTIPTKGVTVLAGDEGIGKSLWWVLVAARITRGRALPQIGLPTDRPRDVVVVLTEDSVGEVKARLIVAGADMSRVHVVSENADGTGTPVFPTDMPAFIATTTGLDVALVVVDAWLDTVSSNLVVKDPQQARQALHPWHEYAVRRECAVLLCTHTNRLTDVSTRDKIGATGALRQKARMLLYAATRDDDVGSSLLVGPDKSNNATVEHRNAVRYAITIVDVRTPTDHDAGTVAHLTDPERTDQWIHRHIEEWRAEQRAADKPDSADDKVRRWLAETFDTFDGEMEAASIERLVAQTGHSWRRVKAVFAAMGGTKAPGGKGESWMWTMPKSGQSGKSGRGAG